VAKRCERARLFGAHNLLFGQPRQEQIFDTRILFSFFGNNGSLGRIAGIGRRRFLLGLLGRHLGLQGRRVVFVALEWITSLIFSRPE
jgi:hypothetical protein